MAVLHRFYCIVFYSCFKEKPPVVVTSIPSFSADLNPELIEEEKKKAKETRRQSVITGLIKAESQKAKWRKPELDKSYEDELRRQELAEERRKRQMEMLERIRNRKMDELALQEDDGSPHFEDCKYHSQQGLHRLEKYLNIQDCLEQSLKIEFALKST